MILILMFFDRLMTVWYQLEDCSDSLQKTYTQKKNNSIKPNQPNKTPSTKLPQPKRDNQTYTTISTQTNLPNQIYPTKLKTQMYQTNLQNQISQLKLIKANLQNPTLPNKTYQDHMKFPTQL